jgi:hypothetical protein
LANGLEHGLTHFIGSIVYVSKSTKAAGTNQFMVIDGQQRLTTISLLILAVLSDPNFSEETGQTKIAQLNRYVRNNDEHRESGLFPKLVLTRSDNDSYREILSAVEEGRMFTSNNRLKRNFDYFRALLQESETSYTQIWQAIGQLDLVYISLNSETDNPQAIFESLNSTGKDLSQTDLVRNFLLMGHGEDTQIRLYENYWLQIEALFRDRQDSEFDDFTRAYVASKLRRYPRKTEVFREFKNYVQAERVGGKSPDELLEDLLNNATWYAQVSFGAHPDKGLEEALSRLRSLRIRSLNPLLIMFLDPKSDVFLPSTAIARAASMIEAYLVRRLFAGLGNNALDNTFSILLSSLSTSSYVTEEALEVAFAALKGKARFPRDAEVVQKGILMDLYSSPLKHHILKSMEKKLDPKGIGLSADLSIEHVMPQKLNNVWLSELGPEAQAIHAKYLHTIGNLTLTPYNSELGNMSFANKKSALVKGLNQTKIAMTQPILNFEKWTEEEILLRASQMVSLVLRVWEAPELLNKEEYKREPSFGTPEDVGLTDLLAAGLIEAGAEIYWPRPNMGLIHEAIIQEDGTIRVSDGDVYSDPSPAAMHFSDSNVNGWKAWRVASVDGDRLVDLRQSLLDSGN